MEINVLRMMRLTSLHVILVTSWFAFNAISMTHAQVKQFNYLSLDGSARYAQAASFPYANPQAPKGGVMRFAVTGTFDNFNSMNGKGNAAEGVEYLYDSLMKSSLDEPGVKYPLLAQRVSYDPDHPSYVIFYLNPDARFSDGSAVTAHDVVATFHTLLTQGAPGIRMYFADIAQVRALSNAVVRFDFKTSTNKEMPSIVADVSIFSAKDLQQRAAQGIAFNAVSLKPPLGSGPYQVSDIEAGRRISYQRNRYYWGKDLPINRGAYNADRLDYIYYRSLDIAFEGFKAGQYTIHTENTARRWAHGYDFTAVKKGWVKQLNYQHANPIATQSFALNTRRAPLNDIRFRQALTYAYDFEWQNKALFYGQYRRLQSFFENSELAAQGRPIPAEIEAIRNDLHRLSALQRRGFFVDWRYPISDASGFNRFNLLVARQILLNAGYRYNAQGQLLDCHGSRQCRPIVLEFLIQQEGLQRTLMPYVRHLGQLGITVNLRKVDSPQYIERRRHYDFDITTQTLPQSLNPGNEQQRFWSCQAAKEPDNYNYAGICDAAIDHAIDRIVRARSRSDLIIQTRVLDRLLRAGYYYIPTYGKAVQWYAYWNFYQHSTRLPQLDIGWQYWWIDQAQVARLKPVLRFIN